MKTTTLAERPETQLAVAEPSVAGMLQAMVERGVTGENVSALEKLCELKWKMDERDAERAFSAAFTALQAETSAIQATKAVPGNDGTTRYKFAPYEEIMATVKPLLVKHGFSISFNSRHEQGRIVSICKLRHDGGHSEVNEFGATLSAPPKSSAAQADGATKTYAKRMALCDALNIVVEQDDDARAVGSAIAPEKAIELEDRCIAAKVNRKAFLAFCGATSFAEIGESKLKEAEARLASKEAERAAASEQLADHDLM